MLLSITEVDASWPQFGHCVHILFEKMSYMWKILGKKQNSKDSPFSSLTVIRVGNFRTSHLKAIQPEYQLPIYPPLSVEQASN